jgi:hypothetical protein
MSQDTFPFVEGEDTAAFEDEPSSNRRALFLAGGVAAALVLGAGGWLLLGGSSDSATSAVVFPPRTKHATTSSTTGTTKASKPLPAPYKEQLGRDPFRALYVIPVAAAAPAAPAAGTVTTPTGTTTGTGTTGTTTGTTPVTPVNKEYKLVLTRVYGAGKDTTAVFSIDGKNQVAKVGSKFGPTSEIVLLSIQQGPKAGQWTGVLQVGDGDPFDVVTGVPAFVR